MHSSFFTYIAVSIGRIIQGSYEIFQAVTSVVGQFGKQSLSLFFLHCTQLAYVEEMALFALWRKILSKSDIP